MQVSIGRGAVSAKAARLQVLARLMHFAPVLAALALAAPLVAADMPPPVGKANAPFGKDAKGDKGGDGKDPKIEGPHQAILGPSVPQAQSVDLTPVAPMTQMQPSDRPLHAVFMKLSRRNERQKPLAAMDPAGFTVNSGELIGQVDEGWVTGLSLTTRRYDWWFDGKVTLTAPPGSFGSSVVLGFRDGKVVRLEALTGKKIWGVSLDSFSERPFLLNGTVLYVVSAAQVLYALDFQTGKTLWLYDGGFPEGLTIRGGAKPIFHENKVYFGVSTGEVIAVASDSGKLIWRYNPAYNDARFHDIVGEMVVRNNHLILSRYDGLVASIDLGAPVRSVTWQQQLTGLTTSAFRGDRYYVGGLNGDVYAIDPDAAGRKVWRAITGAPVTTVTVGENLLWVAGAGGRVTALNTDKGKTIWYDRLGSALASPPTLYEDVLYFTTGQKALYGYRIK